MTKMETRRYWDGFWLGLGIGLAVGTIFITQTRAQTITPNVTGPSGSCICEHSGKQWPCRDAVDFTAPMNCPAVAIRELVCDGETGTNCYFHMKSTCPAPKTVAVCWAADEPK